MSRTAVASHHVMSLLRDWLCEVFDLAVASLGLAAGRFLIRVGAGILLAVAVFILFEAWQRWQSPPEVSSGLMLAFAVVDLAANLVGLFILRPGASQNLNLKGAYLEVLGDLLDAAPRGVDLNEVREHIERVPGAHDLHA